jgi:hypothetical protein
MELDELRVLRALHSIPRGHKNFMVFRTDQASIARRFVECGWVEAGGPSEHGETFRILPEGRTALLNDLEGRIDKSRPIKPQVQAIFGDRTRPVSSSDPKGCDDGEVSQEAGCD